MTKEAKAFIMGLLSASIIMSASNKFPSKNVNKESDNQTVTSENIPNKEEIDESLLISIKDHLNDLLALENGLYDYKQYLIRYSYVEYKDGRNIEHIWMKYENIVPTIQDEMKYYGYKEVIDENGEKLQVKDRESTNIETLINEGYTYIRSSLKTQYCNQETTVSHLFVGYKKIVCDDGEIVIVKSEPTFSIESLISQGYDYVKEGEIYYSFDTSNGDFIEYQDIPGPIMVNQKVIKFL